MRNEAIPFYTWSNAWRLTGLKPESSTKLPVFVSVESLVLEANQVYTSMSTLIIKNVSFCSVFGTSI